MDSLKKHLGNIIGLHARAKNLESSLRFSRIMDEPLSISELIRLLGRAEEVLDMYKQAHRMAVLVNEQESEMGGWLGKTDLKPILHATSSGAARVSDIVRILNSKISKYESKKFDMASADDMHFNDSGLQTDLIKDDIKDTLKSIADLVEYMEAPSLMKLQKQLDKLLRR